MDLVAGAGDRAKRIKAIVGASSGNLVEWYDFYAYAFTSIYFAAAFFPAGDSTRQLMATVRALGVGFTYAVGNALFGGTAEYVALSLKSSGREEWFAWYVTALAGVAFIASLLLPDTRQKSYLDGTWKDES